LKLDVGLSFATEVVDECKVLFADDFNRGNGLLVLLVEVEDDLLDNFIGAQQIKVRLEQVDSLGPLAGLLKEE
jgi:hypothetical protein